MKRLLLLAWGVVLAPAVCSQELVTVETRPGVTQSFYIPAMRKPTAIALLYTGGSGQIRLRREDGDIKFAAGNFLLRSRSAFIRNGVLPVLLDAPSDQSSGMGDEFRRSSKHAADARAVIAELGKRHPGLPVFLVGTSRSTISIANLAVPLAGEIAGVVFTATLVGGFSWTSIRVPTLFVHHLDDQCRASPYDEALRLTRRHAFPLITVRGGLPAKSRMCEPFSAHGFYGKEAETVEAMAAWMQGKPFAKEIP